MALLTPTSELRRVLVSRTDGLGDVITTLPIAVALQERLPDVEVAFLVTPYTAPLLLRIPEVDRVLTISKMRKGLHVMRIYKPDAIIFARPDPKLALEALLARIDVRIGTGYRFYSGLFTRWVYDHRRKGERHESEYGVNLLSPILEGELSVKMPELRVSTLGGEEARNALRGSGVVGDYMVIHPGSRGSALRYAPEKYAQVARELLAEENDLSVVLTAGDREERLAEAIHEQIGVPGRSHLLRGMSLDGLSELLRGGRGFLGSSSGPAHLAALVGRPVVGLYPGLPPLWPARWRPLGSHVSTLVPHPDEPTCSDCGRKHQPENCVARISVERVVDACRGMLVGRDLGTTDYIS